MLDRDGKAKQKIRLDGQTSFDRKTKALLHDEQQDIWPCKKHSTMYYKPAPLQAFILDIFTRHASFEAQAAIMSNSS